MKPCVVDHDDSDDYFLFCEEEKEFMNFAAMPLFSACDSGGLSWDSPIPMASALRELMLDFVEYKGQKWNNFFTHYDYLKDMIDFIHKDLSHVLDRTPKKKKSDLDHAAARNTMIPKSVADAAPKGKSESVVDTGRKGKLKNIDQGSRKRKPESLDHAGRKRKVRAIISLGTALVVKESNNGGVVEGGSNGAGESNNGGVVEGGSDGTGESNNGVVVEGRNAGGGESNNGEVVEGSNGASESNNGGVVEGSNGAGESNNGGGGGERAEANIPVLILRRKLNKSDMCHQQQRVSMPCNQVGSEFETEFLTPEELARLKNNRKHLAITVVDPEGRRHEAGLRWTASGPKTHSYAIGSPWNEIKKINGFREGMEIGIWAVRGPANEFIIFLTTC